jgi:hypothetical protein
MSKAWPYCSGVKKIIYLQPESCTKIPVAHDYGEVAQVVRAHDS